MVNFIRSLFGSKSVIARTPDEAWADLKSELIAGIDEFTTNVEAKDKGDRVLMQDSTDAVVIQKEDGETYSFVYGEISGDGEFISHESKMKLSADKVQAETAEWAHKR